MDEDFILRYVLQFSSSPEEATEPSQTGPPTIREAIVQMWTVFLPTVLSCFQLAPMYITPVFDFISTILPCRCKF